MRELPRQLSAEELAELFEGRTRFVERLAAEPRIRSTARATLVHELPRRREARGPRRASRDRPARRALGALGGRAGLRRRSRGARRARPAQRRLRGAARLPLRRLREPAPEGRDPRRAPRADRATRPTRSSTRARRARRDRERPLAARMTVAARRVLDRLARPRSCAGCTSSPRSPGSARRSTSSCSTSRCAPPKTRRTPTTGVARRARGRSTAAASTTCRSTASRRAALPDHLAWFKWEAYTTWLSGFALMLVLYYLDASSLLVDPSVADLDRRGRRSRSASALLVVAWVVYDVLCRLVSAARRAALRCSIARSSRSRPGARPSSSRAARCLAPGRRDARDDHGRERLLRDHPGPPGADPRQGGGTRARSRRRRSRRSSARSTTTT